jgi:hypothetical protein
MQGHDQYYENQAGEKFVRRSREIFPKTSWGSMGIAVFDWNNDGAMDIYITDMHSDMSKEVGPEGEHAKSDMQWNEAHLKSGGMSVFGNTFFENRGDGTFAEISDRNGTENYWPWGVSAGDVNADGYQDLFVSLSMNYPFRYQTNTLLLNDRGRVFRPAEFLLGVEPRRDKATARPWFRLDCADARQKEHKMCLGANGPVEVWGALGTRSAVVFDLDNDGDLDIVTNEFNSAPQVLVNDLAQRADPPGYVRVALIGTRSNRAGLGARVSLRSGGRSWVQVMDGKSGYLSQSLKPLYFGLGSQADIDEIMVEWPSGITQTLDNPPAGGLLKITEPDS